jgi:hypothetical protein
MAEIEINGIKYVTLRLKSFPQWHIARKLAPFMPAFLPIIRISAMSAAGGIVSAEDQDKSWMPMADALAQMSFPDSNYVMNTCLDVVRRRNETTGTLQPVRTAGPMEEEGILIFENDMNYVVLIKLTIEVCRADIFPSWGELLPSIMGEQESPETQVPAADISTYRRA